MQKLQAYIKVAEMSTGNAKLELRLNEVAESL